MCRASRAVPEVDDRCLELNRDNGTDNIDWELFSDERMISRSKKEFPSSQFSRIIH
jgi:hypothetical protein